MLQNGPLCANIFTAPTGIEVGLIIKKFNFMHKVYMVAFLSEGMKSTQNLRLVAKQTGGHK